MSIEPSADYNPENDPEEQRALLGTLAAYCLYRRTAHRNLTHRRRNSFHALPLQHQKLLSEASIDYPQSLHQLDAAVENNALLSEAIFVTALDAFGISHDDAQGEEFLNQASNEDMNKVRSTLKQFYRDWSAEGDVERAVCYGPIMDALDRRFGGAGTEKWKVNVLIPGAGLGRLVFDIAVAGYSSQGNEFSFHQLMASNYILNCTKQANQHTIHPFIDSFSNHRTRASQVRSVQIPDVHPATMLYTSDVSNPAGERFSMVAGDFVQCYHGGDVRGTFHAVATCFFIDTAVNVISYLETIHNVLAPGGVWINYGPLLWHYEEHPPPPGSHESGVELTLEELLKLVELCGFRVLERKKGEKAGYIGNTESMLKHEYEGEFWVAERL